MDSALERVDGRFLRFILVGGSNFVLGMLLFQAAWLAGGSLGSLRTPAAQAFAYAIGMAWSFAWNRKWVFRSPDRSAARVRGEAFRFAIAQILCLFVSIALVTAAIDGVGLPPLLGWLAAMIPLVLLNFILISRWVFRAG
jgi:putative flippase GtrA